MSAGARSPPPRRPTSEVAENHLTKEKIMNQNSDHERFAHALVEAGAILDEHARSSHERGRVAEEKARSDVDRFEEASGELARARRELSGLEGERAALPLQSYTAGLDGDTALEEELRARYASITPGDLEALRDRCEALEREVGSLGGTSRGAERRAHEKALEAHASVGRSLETFEEQIDALRAAAREARVPLAAGTERLEGQLQFLRQIERDERRAAKGEAARRSEQAGRAVTGIRGKGIG